ncbi:hypothetical protein B0H16DRAFT_1768439 [Mycena metata]|uniref:Ankyrin n=1 Tax=Mycena metata TaxID=1033252 RepID=A0AAD7MUP5_9AGAR|nr:hypothetical protein B0H16DRAFT_1768439 [Mycena metata]
MTLPFLDAMRVSRHFVETIQRGGYLRHDNGGVFIRKLYQNEGLNIDPEGLSPFGRAVFFGDLAFVKEAFVDKTAPNMSSDETILQFGYVSIAVLGAQRVAEPSPWTQIVQLLIANDVFIDSPDVFGHTALHHASSSPSSARIDILVRLLACHGANLDASNAFGEACIVGAMQLENLKILDMILERGADLDSEDVDGFTPRRLFVRCGPQVVAITSKWIRRRSGIIQPYGEKRCDHCGKAKSPLKLHKSKTCKPFTAGNAVILSPLYKSGLSQFSSAPLQLPEDLFLGPKTMVIKAQISHREQHAAPEILVRSRTGSLACVVGEYEDPREFVRLSDAIQNVGTEGREAYFIAELQDEKCLVVRFLDPLAEQPW